MNKFTRKLFFFCFNIIYNKVSSIAYLLAKNDRVTGFGARRTCRPSTTGRGYVRKVVGAVSRPALTYIANKIADVISGTGRRKAVRKPRTVHSAGSWKPSGFGMRKKPRSTLTRKRRTTTVGTGRKTRKPRETLARVRRLLF